MVVIINKWKRNSIRLIKKNLGNTYYVKGKEKELSLNMESMDEVLIEKGPFAQYFSRYEDIIASCREEKFDIK